MAVDGLSRWVPLPSSGSSGSGNVDFTGPYEISSWTGGEIVSILPTASGPGDGEFAADGSLGPRNFYLSGVIIGSSGDDLRSKWDYLTARIGGGMLGKLHANSDRFIYARCSNIIRDPDEGDRGYNHLFWDAWFYCADPFFYEVSGVPTVQAFPVSGTASFTIAGVASVEPDLYFVVSNVGTGGRVSISLSDQAGNVEQFSFEPDAPGIFFWNHENGQLYRDGVDVSHLIWGGFWEKLESGSYTVTINPTGGAVLSAASMTYVPRYLWG